MRSAQTAMTVGNKTPSRSHETSAWRRVERNDRVDGLIELIRHRIGRFTR